jgi:asparagine synthase (glutamine-hydrolysing)
MSALFCWLRRDSNLPLHRLKAAQGLLYYRGRMRTEDIKGPWRGVISVWGDAALFEDDGRLVYLAQAATGINQEKGPNIFLADYLDRREGWWVLLQIDPACSTILVARDRFAGFPLYLYKDKENFILSSETKPIRAVVSVDISLPRLAGLLSSLLPPYFGEDTLFEHVRIVAPGHLHRFDLAWGRKESTSYISPWPPQPLWEAPTEENLAKAARCIREGLKDTVSRNFDATQGIALALSGGVDSSVLAVELRNAGIPFSAFSVTYPECRGRHPDESGLVKLTAKRLGLNVHWVEVGGKEFLDCADELILAHEEPLSTPGLPVAWLQYRSIQRGFTRVTSGLAGDTLFGCLPALWLGALCVSDPLRALREWRVWNSAVPLSALLSGALTFLSPRARAFVIRARIRQRSRAKWLKILPEIPSWYRCDARRYPSYRIQHEIGEILPLLFAWEERRAAYTHLDCALPFIDLTLMRDLERVPVSFRLHAGYDKYVVRRAYTDELPREVIWNRRKLGFDVPLELWLQGKPGERIKDEVLGSSRLAEIVDMPLIEARFDTLAPPLRWRLYTTARFLELFA